MATWNLEGTRCHLFICNGASCMRGRADEVTDAIRAEIVRQGAEQMMHTTRTRCNGRCNDACVVIAYPEGVWYREVTPEIGQELVQQHLSGSYFGSHAVYIYSEGLAATGAGLQGVNKVQSTVTPHNAQGTPQETTDS
ncbi:(2Fe-2S) ferredoxin domain-containing protein [Paenibacillus massiliensis]|uniref:(2Fe-2S) ferredoxin domain-containing protein n=1 Tax=Paenibacillus massiliensis TaxID=225917 RepID=UPI000470D967|nr:(2Fe-2S) ferredoxin domain-containing protein [Paenibacillus massiliensis]